MKVRFCWKTRRKSTIERISERFRVDGMTINHESTAYLNSEEVELLRACENRGYIQIREIVK